jgi:nucleolar protein 53
MKGNTNITSTSKRETRSTSKSFNITGAEKKKKVSKKGKKNWRKNIDVTEFDKKALKKLDQNIVETNAKNMKDEDFFTLDVKPVESVRQKLLREKSEKKKKVKKLSIYEERKIKRMIKNKQANQSNQSQALQPSLVENKKQEQEKVYDLWGNTSASTESIFKFPNSSANLNKNVAYPKIPLPHPGQSYNPAQKDVKHLLNKVVEINKHLIKKNESKVEKEIEPVKLYESSDSEEEEEVKDFTVSNNPAVDDTERKTRKERKRLIQKKLNLIKEKEKQLKRQKKQEISTALGLKRLEKQQKKFLKEQEEKKLKELQEKKEKEN